MTPLCGFSLSFLVYRHKYNEYVMCLKKSSGDEDGCKASRQLALSVCPDIEVEQWDEQRGNGNFLGVQYPPQG